MDRATGGDPAPQQSFGSDATFEAADPAGAEDTPPSDDTDAWRRELATRLERYRARRKAQTPRYPSLYLPFEAQETRVRSHAAAAPAVLPSHPAQASEAFEAQEAPSSESVAPVPDLFEPESNVIAFPRSAAIPVFHAPELAEPVLERPRIVEAPEVLPPPPALGGILIEPPAARESERKIGPEVPEWPATIPRRLCAGLLDGLILSAALSAFAAIFLRLNPERTPPALLVAGFLLVALLLWCAYQFLFIVYTGSTPGLRALKLRLVRFDGSPVPRRVRRWRVLASFLSAFSLGLGYLWSVLDEDGLCWHDRITHTHTQFPSQTE